MAMETHKKPITTFNKEYVGQRILARKASLESRAKQAREEYNALLKKEAELMVEYINRLRLRANRLAEDTQQINDPNLTPKEQLVIADRIMRQASDLTHGRPTLTWNERERRDGLALQINKATAEIDKLEHAHAYFLESPVEEYSITALQKLGLLDVVRFIVTNQES